MCNRRLLYLAFFLYHLRSTVAGGSPPTYVPHEHILLACGSARNSTDDDNRFWTGDVNSSYLRPELSENKVYGDFNINKSHFVPGKLAPYLSGRVSVQPFTYSFPVSVGAKFIRLYFTLTLYPRSTSSKVLFSVKAGPFILLSNFTEADLSGPMFKEYCVRVNENQTLNITFTPSANSSYAFINGIEILSMPPYLYYTSPEQEVLPSIGQQNLSRVGNQKALEIIYRVNVGGTSLSPAEDTGMFRSWEMDDQYLASSGQGESFNSSAELNFTKVPAYTAPGEVYETVRTTGSNSTSSLTWNFPVDSGFVYLVRLHFCEFMPQIVVGQRVFHILIANQTVENAADVIGWSGGNNVPVYRDYVVQMIHGEGEKKIDISVGSKGILNGIEIFNTSSLKGNLTLTSSYPPPTEPNHNGTIIDDKKRNRSSTGDNLTPNSSYPPPREPNHNGTIIDDGKRNRTTIVAAVAGGIFGFVVLLLLLVLWFLKFRPGKGSPKTRKSSLSSRLCQHFPLTKIKAATKDFDQALIIGVGGFGHVYKGYLDGGANPVAIKRLAPGSKQGAHEFETEIEMLSQLRHRHLVSLIGYCDEDNEMILVYDYMVRGTLRDYLCNTNHLPLPWEQRLEICIGAARGLNYLHTGAKHMIIHRDVKTTNILLDEKWVAKVSDFGLSKMGPSGIINAHVSTIVKGTPGYVDPEYYKLRQLTQKSDVYSFGVVLCEVLCAKPPIFYFEEMQAVNLANWVLECYHNNVLDQIVDPSLNNKIMPECLMKFVVIAVSCLNDNGTSRPSMNDVVRDLELALKLQKGVDQDLTLSMVNQSNGICCSNNGQDFSELMSPKGR